VIERKAACFIEQRCEEKDSRLAREGLADLSLVGIYVRLCISILKEYRIGTTTCT
jgi:hypothetical protein